MRYGVGLGRATAVTWDGEVLSTDLILIKVRLASALGFVVERVILP
jgi:hypothetical protein